MSTIEKIARQLALQYINPHRDGAGLPPAKSVSALWWSLNKAEFLAKAAALPRK